MGRTRDIQEQLRQAILTAPFLPATLARESGVSEAVISRFVNGNRSVTMGTAAKLAKVLGLELRPVNRRKGK